VLERVLGNTRTDVATALLDLVREPHLRLHELDYHLTLQALLHHRQSRRVDLGDALLWATARYDADESYTFDEDFIDDSVVLLRP
jgi:predicted nucleic acid-binding protein